MTTVAPSVFTPEEQEPQETFPVNTSFAEVTIEFPIIWPAPALPTVELTHDEIIEAAAHAGTFDFWNSAADDIYNDLLNE